MFSVVSAMLELDLIQFIFRQACFMYSTCTCMQMILFMKSSGSNMLTASTCFGKLPVYDVEYCMKKHCKMALCVGLVVFLRQRNDDYYCY